YIHLNSPETMRAAGFLKKLFDLQLECKITQISHDDIAESELLIVYGAAIGMFIDRIGSSVHTARAVLIDRELPVLTGGETRSAADLPQSLRNLDTCFKSHFKVVGATQRDQHRLRRQVPVSRLLPENLVWETHVRVSATEPTPPSDLPVVGFHSYGNQYRWPNNSSQFSAVYISTSFRTKFYGSLDAAFQKFGRELFDRAEIVPTHSHTEEEFLSSVDFWVYYPNSRLTDQIWEPALVAMASGKVVIMSPLLRWLYGDAAVYAEHEEVTSI